VVGRGKNVGKGRGVRTLKSERKHDSQGQED